MQSGDIGWPFGQEGGDGPLPLSSIIDFWLFIIVLIKLSQAIPARINDDVDDAGDDGETT